MNVSLSQEERLDLVATYRRLLRASGDLLLPGDREKTRQYIRRSIMANGYERDVYGGIDLLRTMHAAEIAGGEIGLKRSSLLAVLLSRPVMRGLCLPSDIERDFGSDTASIVRGLIKTYELYGKNAAINNEHFRALLISFAEDVRVILIIIAERLFLIRTAKNLDREDHRLKIAAEAAYLYAPLAHKLGLYSIKSELEDLSLKLRDRETYDQIKAKLNETKSSRDLYIAAFIAPIEERLRGLRLNFDIKGRTKSIHSIHNKLLKQKTEFERIYDLFAIRIILDTPFEREKAECWQVYSVITDMYQPNPQRLKDWLSVPKSNGYESLHTTVMGPEGRWVEVQIRSKRMDEIAEKGLAAHWKYKGVKDESGLDNWLNSVREVLEHKDASPSDLIADFKLDLYDDEIFVFTPKGDLFKLPKNATVLDFAFAVHTKVGARCVSGRINGKNVPIKHKLQSGDQVEILTSPNQSPKQDWLSIAVTGKARVKIKQSLKEQTAKQVDLAKELLHRRFKNRKIEEDESKLMRLIKKMGYKTVTDFYAAIALGHPDVNTVIDHYLENEKREQDLSEQGVRSVENYSAPTVAEDVTEKGAVLIIDENLTGVDYALAKCCNPIYGDEIFGFVSSQGIKIHRICCPNAPSLFKRYGYRIVQSRWTSKSGAQYPVTLKVVGRDDIGIVTNITSVISKENGMMLRSINVDSKDGLFQGTITVMLSDTSAMDGLIRKIRTVKGVKQVIRY
jgi:GTP pyrophosphokinase